MQDQNLRSQFLLRDDVTFLNYGSFGACPKPVFEVYQQYQRELEQEPVEFIANNGLRYLEESREVLGEYLNCHKNDIVYVPNPTYAINVFAKNMALQPGDEILTTSLEYGACDKTWEYYCLKTGAKYIKQPIRFPLQSKEDFVEQFFKGLTANTKLVFISHITSSTGLRFPVEEICAIAREKGIMTCIDGAHAPGQIPIDLKKLDVDLYTGACHKWMMTAKGSSFMYVKKEHQHLFDPLVISWGYKALVPSDSLFQDYHQVNGTRDFSPFLTIPAAIAFMKKWDWEKVSASCRKLVQENALPFCNLLGAAPLAPINDDFILQLYSAEIKTAEPEKLHRHFFDKYRIQVPVMQHGEKVYLRYSINGFNSQEDLNKLFTAIGEIKSTTRLIL